jgi:hypothetical protein
MAFFLDEGVIAIQKKLIAKKIVCPIKLFWTTIIKNFLILEY